MSNDLAAVVSKVARHLSSKSRLSNAFIGSSKNAQSPPRTQLSNVVEGENGHAGERDNAAEGGKAAVDTISPAGEIAEAVDGRAKINEGDNIGIGRIDHVGERPGQSYCFQFTYFAWAVLMAQ